MGYDNKLSNLRKLDAYNKSKIRELEAGVNESFSITVSKFVTDTDGKIISNTSIPVQYQQKLPVYLFGEFDRAGGYSIGNRLTPPINDLVYILNDTVGNTFDLLSFSGTNNIKNKLTTGDLYFLYSDSASFPTFFIWVIISAQQRAYSSILKNPIVQGLNVELIKFTTDNDAQFGESWQLVNYNMTGDYKRDFIEPYLYRPPETQQSNLIDMTFSYKIFNFSGIYFYMLYDSDLMSLNFNYKKP